MRTSLEFHDSIISAIALEGASMRISMDAYVHRWDLVDGRWRGTGWTQPVQIQLMGAANQAELEFPVDVSDGEVLAGHVRYRNLVPMPFKSTGPATLRFELVTANVLVFNGRDLVIEPTGEARYVEDLPDEFSPEDAG